jgi:hypothetical protein
MPRNNRNRNARASSVVEIDQSEIEIEPAGYSPSSPAVNYPNEEVSELARAVEADNNVALVQEYIDGDNNNNNDHNRRSKFEVDKCVFSLLNSEDTCSTCTSSCTGRNCAFFILKCTHLICLSCSQNVGVNCPICRSKDMNPSHVVVIGSTEPAVCIVDSPSVTLGTYNSDFPFCNTIEDMFWAMTKQKDSETIQLADVCCNNRHLSMCEPSNKKFKEMVDTEIDQMKDYEMNLQIVSLARQRHFFLEQVKKEEEEFVRQSRQAAYWKNMSEQTAASIHTKKILASGMEAAIAAIRNPPYVIPVASPAAAPEEIRPQ